MLFRPSHPRRVLLWPREEDIAPPATLDQEHAYRTMSSEENGSAAEPSGEDVSPGMQAEEDAFPASPTEEDSFAMATG